MAPFDRSFAARIGSVCCQGEFSEILSLLSLRRVLIPKKSKYLSWLVGFVVGNHISIGINYPIYSRHFIGCSSVEDQKWSFACLRSFTLL